MSPFLLSLSSLAKRFQEDAERCLAEMQSSHIHYAAYDRIQSSLQAAKERGVE